MEIETKKILVPVDSDPTTLKAVRYATHKALEMQNSGTPYSLVLVNLYSSFDLTGSSERDGKLALEQAESFAEASGVRNGLEERQPSQFLHNFSVPTLQTL